MGDEKPTVARFAVASQNPQSLTSALLLADRIHLALVSLSKGAEVFTGCDSSGKPLQGHRHAHILCESNPALGRGSQGEVTHATIYAPMGFGQREQEALQGLREIRGRSVELALLGLGQPQDFGGLDAGRGQSPLLAKSRTWVSRTPFLPTRHPKRTRSGEPKRDARGLQIGSPEHELQRLLGLAGFPVPVAVEPMARDQAGRAGGSVAGLPVPEGERRWEAGRGCGLRVPDRVPGAGARAGGGGVCGAFWDGDV